MAQDSPEAADRLLLALDEKIERLPADPEIGNPRDDTSPGAGTQVHGRYTVPYGFDAAADIIEIVASAGRPHLGLLMSRHDRVI